jgi:hypothetical protein
MQDATKLAGVLVVWALASCGSSKATVDGGQIVDAGASAASVKVTAAGEFTVAFQNPSWTFGGSLGASPSDIAETTGSDAVGAYHSISFSFSNGAAQAASIRAYDALPVTIFTVTYPNGATNPVTAFPTFSTYPALPYHATYSDDTPFAPITFTELGPDSPFVFFDDQANAFILSAASHFMNAASALVGGKLTSGIDPTIPTLPAGFSQQVVLVAQPGIHQAYETWGGTLLALSGKARVTNDATTELERFGYWTDSHAYYYFHFEKALGYPGTLIAVRDYFAKLGLPLAYMQLDAWWFPKGPDASWSQDAGMYLYEADKTLFPDGLQAFRNSIGLPLITEANWITVNSPYRSEYVVSHNVAIDRPFWDLVANYIADRGVVAFEQDFLNQTAAPLTNNLNDQDAYLDNMAGAMKDRGLAMQYCMPLPRHFLQSTKYSNLLTTRVSGDRFERSHYQGFFYGSLLASSLGIWPWSDSFFSSQTDNVLLSTLSGGVFGVGDKIGTASAENLRRTLRPDGVIVKPDVPATPLDQTFIDQAKGLGNPLVASTYSDFGGARVSYVYAFTTGGSTTSSFSPATLGVAGQAYVYDFFARTGRLIDATESATKDLGKDGSGYWVVAPVGRSGIAFLGDEGKWVSLGKKRFSSVSDDGTLSVSLRFARGEGPVTLHGYAAKAPVASASKGKVGSVQYDASAKTFRVEVTAEGTVAEISLR